jgi:radical SAM-linked protein
MVDIAQRWRVVYRRGMGAAELAQRAELEAWESGLSGTDLPLATSGAAYPRPRLSMPPPLPVGFAGARELLDLHLVARSRSADVRAGVVRALPPDHDLIELYDVWVGAPALPAVVIALDYMVTASPDLGGDRLAEAAEALLGAEHLERARRRGERETRYDLRPFLLDVRIDRAAATCRIRMRLGVHPEQGTGRPDEVVAALGERLGADLSVTSGVRTRIWTADEQRPARIEG